MVSKELGQLIERFRRERHLRDGGIAARKTYAEIKEFAKPHELIALLEEVAGLRN